MTLPRLGISLSCGLLAGLGLAWFVSQAAVLNPATSRLEPGIPYAVEVSSEHSELDLTFDDRERYLLIVSSLGSAARTHTVTLESREVSESRLHPMSPLDPWGLRTTAPGKTSSRLRSCRESSIASSEAGGECPARPCRQIAVAAAEKANVLAKTHDTPALERSFYLHVTDGSLDDENQYAEVQSTLLAEGTNVRIYLDRQQSRDQLARGVVEEILRLLDEEVIPATRARLGCYRDIDGDHRFAVLLSPWLDRLQGGRTSLGGFARGSDFRADVPAPFSNHCDMLYLNSNIAPGPHLKTLLAHEYAHAVCFSERLAFPTDLEGPADEEDWLNEAIAHCAENVCSAGWSNLDYRISRYLNDPAVYPLVVPDYYRAGLWRDHGCRGATYLFLRWCVDHFGDDLLQNLVRTPKRGVQNLELVTGCKFEDLYRRWTLALIEPHFAGTTTRNAFSCSCQDREPAIGSYTSLNLYGRLASWGLAGPRTETWNVDSGARRLDLKGTSTSFLDLRAAHSGGVRRIHLCASHGAELQVSIVKLSSDSPLLETQANWCRPQSRRPALADGRDPEGLVRLNVTSPDCTDLTIESIACEWNAGETKQSHYFTPKDLALYEESQPARRDDQTTVFRRRFCFPVETPASRQKLIIKVQAHNSRHGTFCAWSELEWPVDSEMQARAESKQAASAQ